MAGAHLSLALVGWGTARANLDQVAALRKLLPDWVPEGTAGHFLKHADEQTVVAVSAVDQAIRSGITAAADFGQWAIIAAPRFIGRLAGTATLERFCRGGGPAISPHVIPQHSLHSPSGALSILLSSKKPNIGVGGTGDSLSEGLFAALTVPVGDCQGIWLVATAWDPEPQIDDQGNCTNQPTCYAAALALQGAVAAGDCGSLRRVAGDRCSSMQPAPSTIDAAQLCRQLTTIVPGGPSTRLHWALPFGGTLLLEVSKRAHSHAAAA